MNHSLTTAEDVGAALEQKLLIVGDGITMTSLQQAYTLYLDPSVPLTQIPTYYEFNYATGCSPPQCPSDFGPLDGRSKEIGISGSIQSTALYTVDLASSAAVTSQTQIASLVALDPTVGFLINRTAYLDLDYPLAYTLSNDTVQIYLSWQYSGPAGSLAFKRTYPGLNEGTTPTNSYNPTTRPWWRAAGSNNLGASAYRETFTRELVINLSAMKYVSSSLTFVTAALVLLADVQQLVTSVSVGVNGYAALVRASTGEVLIYDQQTQLFNDALGRFTYLSEIDPGLKVSGTATVGPYTKNGQVYYVAQSPIVNGNLVLLVYALRADAFTTFPKLQAAVAATETRVTAIICAICGATLVIVGVSVLLITRTITGPLRMIDDVSKQVQEISAKEERNYGLALEKIKPVMGSRTAELGDLVENFTSVVTLLDERERAKDTSTKYPKNPLYRLAADLAADSDHVASIEGSSESPPPAYEELDRKRLSSHKQHSASDSKTMVWSSSTQTKPSPRSTQTKQSPRSTQTKQSPRSRESQGSTDDDAEDEDNSGEVSAEASSADASASEQEETTTDWEMGIEVYSGGISQSEQEETTNSEYSIGTTTTTKRAAVVREHKCGLNCLLRYPVAILLIIGVAAAMAVSLALLFAEGQNWMTETGDLMVTSEVANLQSIAGSEGLFVTLYFERLAFQARCAASWVTSLLDGNLQDPNWLQNGDYLQSYSLDTTEVGYAYPLPTSTSQIYTVSGYFIAGIKGCTAAGTCNNYATSNDTRHSSLFDIKLQALYHGRNELSFVQTGDVIGETRILPYMNQATYSAGTKCFTDIIPPPSYCDSCSNPANYLPYDPRCRSWYYNAINGGATTTTPQFSAPRVASTGNYVTSGSILVRAGGLSTGALYGVLSFNFLAQTLSNAIDTQTILSHGYVFVIDATAVYVILHPKIASSGCAIPSTLQCVDGLSGIEATNFAALLRPLLAAGGTGVVDFTKGGASWKLGYSRTVIGPFTYGLIAAVPLSDIQQPVTDSLNKLQQVEAAQLAIYVVVVVLISILIFILTCCISRNIVHPINDLCTICVRILDGDLTSNVGASATSKETKDLLDAFSGMVIALRFGSESYVRGNNQRAKEVFSDALQLYTELENERGIGISQNNLAAAHMRLGNFKDSEEMYVAAVANARAALKRADGLRAKRKATQVLADRLGNFALLRLDEEDPEKAAELLDEALVLDDEAGNVRGTAQRQGIRGKLELARGDYRAALAYFEAALGAVQNARESLGHEAQGEDVDELAVAEQYCHLYLGLFGVETGNTDQATICLARSIVKHHVCDIPALADAMRLLHKLYTQAEDEENAAALAQTMAGLEKKYGPVFSVRSVSKAVVLCLDYSGSMAGRRIKLATESMVRIYDSYINTMDYVSFIRFNNDAHRQFELGKKRPGDRELLVQSRFPGGGTAFRDAIHQALESFTGTQLGGRRRWIIALTDGEDTSSQMNAQTLEKELRRARVALIVVAVMMTEKHKADVRTLCDATKSVGGCLIDVEADSEQAFAAAFGTVAKLITGQVQIETY